MKIERIYLSADNMHGSNRDTRVTSESEILAYLMDKKRPAREYVFVKYYANHGTEYAHFAFRAWYNEEDGKRDGDRIIHDWEQSQKHNANSLWSIISADLKTDSVKPHEFSYSAHGMWHY